MTSDLELKLAYLEGKRDAYCDMIGRVDPETDELIDEYISRLEHRITSLMKEIDIQNTAL